MPKGGSISLSIVTPTLNCAASLSETLRSVAPLIAAGAEHFIVDSGSTDGTLEFARNSGSTVLTYPPGNMYGAINYGMRHATGEWLTYINGDDVLYADAIFEMLYGAEGDAFVQYGNIDLIDDVGRFLFSWRSPSERWISSFIAVYSPIPQQGTLFRRQVFHDLKGFNTDFRYAADYDFWIRALKGGFLFQKYTAKSVAAFRLLETQLSQARKSEMAPEGNSMRAILKQEYSPIRHAFLKAWAIIYRNTTNIDSHLLRAMRGRDLDRR